MELGAKRRTRPNQARRQINAALTVGLQLSRNVRNCIFRDMHSVTHVFNGDFLVVVNSEGAHLSLDSCIISRVRTQ